MKKLITICMTTKLFRQAIVILAVIYVATPCVMASCTYVFTNTGNVVKVDLNAGSTQIVASVPSSLSLSGRGITYDSQGRIYLGTMQSSTAGWDKRVVRITPQANGAATVEPFTPPLTGTYGVGQIGFNSKGELFVAGDWISRYSQNGELLGTLGSNAYVSLLVDGDKLYSAAYFSPHTLLSYDTSGSQPVGGVIAQLQLPTDYCIASLCKSSTGNLAIGFSGGHTGGAELWEYNLQTQGLHKLFDCGQTSQFAQYDPFSNTYLMAGANELTVLNAQGQLVKTISVPGLDNGSTVSNTFVPEPATLLLLGLGGLILRKRNK